MQPQKFNMARPYYRTFRWWWWWWLSIYNAPKNSMHSMLMAPIVMLVAPIVRGQIGRGGIFFSAYRNDQGTVPSFALIKSDNLLCVCRGLVSLWYLETSCCVCKAKPLPGFVVVAGGKLCVCVWWRWMSRTHGLKHRHALLLPTNVSLHLRHSKLIVLVNSIITAVFWNHTLTHTHAHTHMHTHTAHPSHTHHTKQSPDRHILRPYNNWDKCPKSINYIIIFNKNKYNNNSDSSSDSFFQVKSSWNVLY